LLVAPNSKIERNVLLVQSVNSQAFLHAVLNELKERNPKLGNFFSYVLRKVERGELDAEYYLGVRLACVTYKQLDWSIKTDLPCVESLSLNPLIKKFLAKDNDFFISLTSLFFQQKLIGVSTCAYFETNQNDRHCHRLEMLVLTVIMIESMNRQHIFDCCSTCSTVQ